MSNHRQKPECSNDDAVIVFLDPNDGVRDTTWRPIPEERRNAILKRLERQAELRKMMEEMKKKEEEGKKPDDSVST